MFHAEMRSGGQVVRQFNLDERALWIHYLAPLLDGRKFLHEGHEWDPRKTRIVILEGPELKPHELALGRGWPNAQRASGDVTAAVLARARELHTAAQNERRSASASAGNGDGAGVGAAPAPAAAESDRLTALRERLIGRLDAGPVTAAQIDALAVSVMPGADAQTRRAECERVVWELLLGGQAQLAQSGR